MLAAVASLVGCGGDSASANPYTRLLAVNDSAVGVVCECFAAFEFETAAECEAEFGDEDTATEIACVEAVYEANRADVLATVNCEIAALNAAETCVGRVNACDPDAIEACIDAVETAQDACPELSEAIETAVSACYDG